MTASQYFVTGTSTGIGKTWLSAALAAYANSKGQQVIYYKPIQTGVFPGNPPDDPHWVMETCRPLSMRAENRYCFEPATAPLAADPKSQIDLSVIKADVEAYKNESDCLLVEGAGGLMVPITQEKLMIDMIQELELPVILVADSGLGTINHIILSLEALKQRDIPVAALIINFYPKALGQADAAIKTLMDTLNPFIHEDLLVGTLNILSDWMSPPTIPVLTALLSPEAKQLVNR